mgnify:CR=1 FL=1
MKNTNKISGFILMALIFINVTGYLFYKHELKAVDKQIPTTHCLAANNECQPLTSNNEHNQIKLKYEKIAFIAFFIEGFVIVGWNEILKRNK